MLILDIEAATQRPLVVYFSQLSKEIDHTDPDDLAEILSAISSDEADIMIQTPGGSVDACEKIVSVLKAKFKSYRVIVPSWAKSAGTVIALSSSEIVFGINSELGPIDPQWKINGNSVPCELVASDPAFPQHMRTMADLATKRMSQMASDILANGMMIGKPPAEVTAVIQKVSASTGYMSHGAVIDTTKRHSLVYQPLIFSQMMRFGGASLLYCMYDFDTKSKALGKIIEGNKFSISRPL